MDKSFKNFIVPLILILIIQNIGAASILDDINKGQFHIEADQTKSEKFAPINPIANNVVNNVRYATLSDTKGVNLTPYLRELADKVGNKFNRPNTEKFTSAIVKFEVNNTGAIINPVLVRPSKSAELNKAALEAIDNVSLSSSLLDRYFELSKENLVAQMAFEGVRKNNSNSDNTDFGPFMKELQKTLRSSWYNLSSNHPTRYGKNSHRVTVFFDIDKEGNIISPIIWESTGNKIMEEDVLGILSKYKKFKPLPTEFPDDYISILFTFEYNVFQGLYNSEKAGSPINQGEIFDNTKVEKIPVSSQLSNGWYAYFPKTVAHDNGYTYTHALDATGADVYKIRVKADCTNGLIGIKRTYAGSTVLNLSEHMLKSYGLTQFVKKFPDEAGFKLKPYTTNKNTKALYEYACSD